jgi:hypothetical protein
VTYAHGGLARALFLPRVPADSVSPQGGLSRGAAEEEYMKQRVLCLSPFIGVVFGMSTIGAQGQIIGQLEANIPFTFHAGGAKLPPGKYTIHVLDNTDLTQTPFIPHNFGR